MDNKIIVEVKPSYGTQWVYVVSNHKEAIETLTGKKTVSPEDIQALKVLGFVFAVKPQAVTV